MRLWSISPKYLDSKGLVALWRESLLAQKVLKGNTRGYINHPQLLRFREHNKPELAIARYLYYIYKEANNRNYNFNVSKINNFRQLNTENVEKIHITSGQVLYEFNHLKNKLSDRNPDFLKVISKVKVPHPHPLFKIVKGEIADWEKI